MNLTGFITFILIGGIAGWIAGLISKGSGFGVARNIAVGIGGAFLGSLVFGLLGIGAYSLIGRLIFAVLGALLLLWIFRCTRK